MDRDKRFNFSDSTIMKNYRRLHATIHHNNYLLIGFYGMLLILLLYVLTPWLAYHGLYCDEGRHLLPPAWDDLGEVEHLLGTDSQGRDILSFLLLALQNSLTIAVAVTLLMIVISSLSMAILLYFPKIRGLVQILLQTVSAIPPLLLSIIVILCFGHSLLLLAITIAVVQLPRFIYNLRMMLLGEYQKNYITAARLDGVPSLQLLLYTVLPNIRLAFIGEAVQIFSTTLLAITTLTFLGFGNQPDQFELGMMLQEMATMIDHNCWAFVVPGLVILLIILLINLFYYGLTLALTRQRH